MMITTTPNIPDTISYGLRSAVSLLYYYMHHLRFYAILSHSFHNFPRKQWLLLLLAAAPLPLATVTVAAACHRHACICSSHPCIRRRARDASLPSPPLSPLWPPPSIRPEYIREAAAHCASCESESPM